MSQRLLPHLKAVILLLFLLISTATISSETVAAPLIRTDQFATLNFGSAQRILIFSPHPDDLILAAGGLIQHAVDAGIQVQPVIVSYGDETIPSSVKIDSSRSDGERSENEIHCCLSEARQALVELGVSPDQIIFLGYPADRWQSGSEESLPTVDAQRRTNQIEASKFFQETLVEDLKQIIAAYPSDIILIPHPEDIQPDHKAVSNAARTAITKSDLWQTQERPLVLGYLVDYDAYPDSVDLINLYPLLPPASLIDPVHIWYSVTLDDNYVQAKRKAINLFPLDNERIAWVLSSFARPNEIFTQLTTAHMPSMMPKSSPDYQIDRLFKQLPTITVPKF